MSSSHSKSVEERERGKEGQKQAILLPKRIKQLQNTLSLTARSSQLVADFAQRYGTTLGVTGAKQLIRLTAVERGAEFAAPSTKKRKKKSK